MNFSGSVLFFVIAVLLGATFPLQAGANATLGKHLGQPALGALGSGLITLLGIGVYLAVARIGLPPAAAFGQPPAWSWGGGLLGAGIVVGSTLLATRLGSATLQGLIIGGQLLSSVLVDHFALAGFDAHPIHWPRLLGVALALIGIVLIAKF